MLFKSKKLVISNKNEQKLSGDKDRLLKLDKILQHLNNVDFKKVIGDQTYSNDYYKKTLKEYSMIFGYEMYSISASEGYQIDIDLIVQLIETCEDQETHSQNQWSSSNIELNKKKSYIVFGYIDESTKRCLRDKSTTFLRTIIDPIDWVELTIKEYNNIRYIFDVKSEEEKKRKKHRDDLKNEQILNNCKDSLKKILEKTGELV